MRTQWFIPHPGTGLFIEVESFEEAMDKWFEGWNIPRLVTNGKAEDFTVSCKRVTEALAKHKTP